MGRTTDKIREKIQRKEEKLGRELTENERKNIIQSVKRRTRRENFFRGAFLAMGITIGAGGHALLTSGEESKKQGVESQKENFIKGLAVDVKEMTREGKKQAENSRFRNNIKNEIEELESSESVLEYIKKIYVEEYNKRNEEKIHIGQLSFYKSREKEIHKDIAENGDTIFRATNSGEDRVDTTAGVISAYIQNEEGRTKQQIINQNNIYKTVYSYNEKVEKYEDNFLADMAQIVDAGIDWSIAMDQKQNSTKIQQEYKNRLINSIVNYKTENIEQIEDNEI